MGPTALHARQHVKMSTEYRSMVPLNSHRACIAAEALQASHTTSLLAHRTKLSRVRCSSPYVCCYVECDIIGRA